MLLRKGGTTEAPVCQLHGHCVHSAAAVAASAAGTSLVAATACAADNPTIPPRALAYQ